MLDGSHNGCYGNINTDIENKITCGSDSYPKTKDDNVGILNNYHVGKQHIRDTSLK